MLRTSKLLSILAITCVAAWPAVAQDQLTGDEIVANINAREDGQHVTREFTFELTNRAGRTRTQNSIAYRRHFGDEKRTVIFYTEPTRVRDTAFLTFDYADPNTTDDQWLYLPALRKVRRISAADRGDYFLGTDFNYEEIKKEQKIEPTDYIFETIGTKVIDGRELLVVAGKPSSEDVANELKLSKIIWHVDPEIWMSRRTDYYDTNGNHARTLTLEGVDVIDGFITATQIFAENHKTKHSSRLIFSNTDYETEIKESMFTQAQLRRGQ